ncbi:MAG: tRNA threonylcarbamoyladenosine biosynthesis protein TsaB [Flavobacterium sp. SCGC AAA160-P02]|nr:MAG: tRNA threonylcarbamoyladenosine biosynthesis protein TsaB [Flavobacterium sp. SCGC AAA160-P02]
MVEVFISVIFIKKILAYILNIETSTKNCSVSIAKSGELISLKELNNGSYSHAEMLHPLIKEALSESELSMGQINAIAVGKGPGSYTGLRIGVSSAKGICFANDIPLISINSLEVLAHSISIDTGLIIPMIDARRMEVYSTIFDNSYNMIRETKSEIIDENSFSEQMNDHKIYIVGDAATKCRETITNSNAIFIDNKFPSSKEMAKLSFIHYNKNIFEDVAYFEPFYLKDFIATQEKKKF